MSDGTAISGKESFALYGFHIEIPDNWRVEVNQKGTRQKGDVVFQSKGGNRIFVSWGPLDQATRRFKTLEEHRDNSVKQIEKSPDVKAVDVRESREEMIGGHRALITHVSASVKAGMLSKAANDRDMWSMHFYCPNTSRYYVLYSMLRDANEFPDFSRVFITISRSMTCHRGLSIESELQ